MQRAWPALVVLLCSAARGQAPAYSAAGIVNAANFAPGPFAANSVVTLFGSNLSNNSDCKGGVSASEALGGNLPTQLDNASLFVANMPAPVLYVSECQINFLIPTELTTGNVNVAVVKQGVVGPQVPITLVSGAPALFSAGGYALAEDWNNANAVITGQTPARPGDMVILYATGLGPAGNNPTGQVPSTALQINNLALLVVSLNGAAVDPQLIKYAGLTPGYAGLYQINMILPANLAADPEIRVAIGSQSSPAGLKLAVQPAAPAN